MKRYIDNVFGFMFLYPDEWDFEKNDNVILIYDPKSGLGTLQLSAYYVNNDHTVDLRADSIPITKPR